MKQQIADGAEMQKIVQNFMLAVISEISWDNAAFIALTAKRGNKS